MTYHTYRDYDWLRPAYDAWISNGYAVTLIDSISPGINSGAPYAGTAPGEIIDLIRQIRGIELEDSPNGRTE